jgi:hypothetical protein
MQDKYIKSINIPNFERFPELIYNFSFKRKYNISKIKINRKLFAFNNSINKDTLNNIVYNFQLDFWDPIILNEN